MMITPDTTSTTRNERIAQLVRLDAHLMTADGRSIRWLYDRYDGLGQFEESLKSSKGIESMIKFFENEPGILAEMDNDALEWGDG